MLVLKATSTDRSLRQLLQRIGLNLGWCVVLYRKICRGLAMSDDLQPPDMTTWQRLFDDQTYWQ